MPSVDTGRNSAVVCRYVDDTSVKMPPIDCLYKIDVHINSRRHDMEVPVHWATDRQSGHTQSAALDLRPGRPVAMF